MGQDAISNIVRKDDHGHIDDVAITGELFRLERMDNNVFWIAIYRGNERVVFHLRSSSPITCDLSEDGLGTSDDPKVGVA